MSKGSSPGLSDALREARDCALYQHEKGAFSCI
jgi:hypothetical protein